MRLAELVWENKCLLPPALSSFGEEREKKALGSPHVRPDDCTIPVRFFAKPKAGIADAFFRHMMHKQHAMTLNEAWPHTGWFKSHVREIVASLMKKVQVPTGYQDQNGFHYGAEPTKTQIQWPPA
jgi:hypothetical protein